MQKIGRKLKENAEEDWKELKANAEEDWMEAEGKCRRLEGN